MSMTTELAQRMKAAALKAKQANDLYLEGKITLSECVVETKDHLDYSDNPNNTLALVEALEAKDKRNTELEDLLEAEIKSWMQRYDSANNRREAAEKRNAELEQKADIYDMLREDYEINGSLVDFVDWQSKRIAELEARKVKLPVDREPETDVSGYDGTEFYRAGWNARGRADREALVAAGVAVEGE